MSSAYLEHVKVLTIMVYNAEELFEYSPTGGHHDYHASLSCAPQSTSFLF
jgi:hypothetical protein